VGRLDIRETLESEFACRNPFVSQVRWGAIKEKTIVLDAIAKSRFADIYSAYAAWYADSVSDSDKYRITKIAVTKWLEKAGFKKEKTGGNVYILGAIITIGVLP
jgi:hypothetical protein